MDELAKRVEEVIAKAKRKKPTYQLTAHKNYEKEKNPSRYVIEETVDNYTTIVCEIARVNPPKKEPYWFISNNTHNRSTEIKFPNDVHFPDKDQAFYFAVAVRRSYLYTIENRPLPVDANEYISAKARSLKERTRATVSSLYDLQREKWDLLILARKFGVEEAEAWVDDSDLGVAINNLLTLKSNEDENIPFFSEACLYDLVGKDKARTILALLKKLISIVSPNEAIKV